MRKSLRRLIPALYCVTACTTLLAQNEGQLQSDFRREGADIAKDCSALKTIFGCLQTLVTGKPLHFTAGSIAPQNGVGFGGAFVFDKNYGESWRTSTNADAFLPAVTLRVRCFSALLSDQLLDRRMPFANVLFSH